MVCAGMVKINAHQYPETALEVRDIDQKVIYIDPSRSAQQPSTVTERYFLVYSACSRG